MGKKKIEEYGVGGSVGGDQKTKKEEAKKATEKPITHLLNPINKRVFQVTPDIITRKDLIPCDKDGKKVPDHRVLNRIISA